MTDISTPENKIEEGTIEAIESNDIVETAEIDQDNDQEIDQKNEEAPVKYKNGQLLRFVRIRFPGNSKSFPFLIGKKDYTYGQKVVAMSDRGLDIGYINSFPYEVKFREAMLPLNLINKVATSEDMENAARMKESEKDAENVCKKLIEKYKLDMDLTHVELIQFGKKAVFYFIAPKRVDFRDLVKELVTELKIRVELRQISIRDRAAALGGIGPCGRELCCSTFLSNYGRVNIKMAKNQNMSLNPTRLNGLCGQLKCCISYEDNVYTHQRESLPRENSFIELKNGDRGKVLKLHILILQFDVLTDQGNIRRYTFDQYDSKVKLPKDWKFPERFNHISNETSQVIGKEEKVVEDEFSFGQDNVFEAEVKTIEIDVPEKSAKKEPEKILKEAPEKKPENKPEEVLKKEPVEAKTSEDPRKKTSENKKKNHYKKNQHRRNNKPKKTDTKENG